MLYFYVPGACKVNGHLFRKEYLLNNPDIAVHGFYAKMLRNHVVTMIIFREQTAHMKRRTWKIKVFVMFIASKKWRSGSATRQREY